VIDAVLHDAGAATASEDQHGEQQADRPAHHQDHADDVDVEAAELRVDREGEDRADRKQEDADADAHGFPPGTASGSGVRR
jgi:hypothetical protein